ncbi:MAG: peptidoglycan DD-metalloendopeptidase family protein [Cyclobacteriaceae bacterium]|nr:peptidoglycan DD-metalloendopeptidase family protein [Cyclobacteriaceae bacterium]
MRQLKYRYNPTTCRYEAVPFQPKKIVGALFIFLSLSGLLFVALLFLHSLLFTTQTEQALLAENVVLKTHRITLKSELTNLKESLRTLEKTETKVHDKLAKDLPSPTLLSSLEFKPKKKPHDEFEYLLSSTRNQSEKLLQKTRDINAHLGYQLAITDNDLKLLFSMPTLHPIDNTELTKLASGFGERVHPFHKAKYFHKGVDFVAPRGTPVYASASGKVTEVMLSNLQMGMGNVIEIDHGQGYKTRYAHLTDVKVKPGQVVQKGAEIGTVGMTGGAVSPHLHYEVLKNSRHVDPADYLLEGLSSTEYAALRLLAKQKNQALD